MLFDNSEAALRKKAASTSEVAQATSPSIVSFSGAADSSQLSQNHRLTSSYSKTVQTDKYPTRDQAIIMDALENTPIRDYAVAIGKIIGSKNLISISKISNNRVCVCVRNSEIAKNLVNTTTQVIVNKSPVALHLLNSRALAKKFIISNVCPWISNEMIISVIEKQGIRIMGKITAVKTGITDAGYEHLISHRRQMFIHQDDVDKMPEALVLKVDNLVYHLYFSSDKIKCSQCGLEGHIRKNCQNTEMCLDEPSSINPILNEEQNFPTRQNTLDPTDKNDNSSEQKKEQSLQLPKEINPKARKDIQQKETRKEFKKNMEPKKRTKHSSNSSSESPPRSKRKNSISDADQKGDCTESLVVPNSETPSMDRTQLDDEAIGQMFSGDKKRIYNFKRLYGNLLPWKSFLDKSTDPYAITYHRAIEFITRGIDTNLSERAKLLENFALNEEEAATLVGSIFDHEFDDCLSDRLTDLLADFSDSLDSELKISQEKLQEKLAPDSIPDNLID